MNLDAKEAYLVSKIKICSYILKEYLQQIKCIEDDTTAPINEKILKIKKIKEELTKVGTEIDSIKKEIKLVRTHNLN